MIETIAVELGVPEGAVWALAALWVVVVVAQVWALVDLWRRPRVLWDRKWIWVLIILFLSNGIGVILYAAIGRNVPQQVEDVRPEPDSGARSDAARAAVETLYGDSGTTGSDPSEEGPA
jgi:hypothetical protein